MRRSSSRARRARRTVIAGAGIAIWLAMAAPAQARHYTVAQCYWGADGDATWIDPTNGGAFVAERECGDPAAGDVFIRPRTADRDSTAASGEHAQWRWSAPAGTTIFGVRGTWWRRLEDDFRQRLTLTTGAGDVTYFAASDTTNTAPDTFTSSGTDGGPWRSFEDRLVCGASGSQVCNLRPRSYAAVNALTITLEDPHDPSAGTSGDLISDGWKRGVRSLSYTATDVGSGARFSETLIDGSVVRSTEHSCDKVRLAGTWSGAAMRPCPLGTLTGTHSIDTSDFADGTHALSHCASDFAENETCTPAREVHFDNTAPGSPLGFTLAGGSSWRPTNDFDVSWADPAQGAGSPISGAFYRIAGSGYDSGIRQVNGSGITSLADLRVPAPGQYTLSVWLADAAGNADPASAEQVALRFDDVVPGEAEPQAPSGWISRGELPYQLTWAAPSLVGVSGVSGYAARVDRVPSGDPGTINHPGDERLQRFDELPEGLNYAHVAAFSGAGLRGQPIGHVALKVDRTDPQVVLGGAPEGWANGPVALTARASDVLSGMNPASGDDGRPFTAVQIDSGQPVQGDGPAAAVDVRSEGIHAVRYWAQDLAGNLGPSQQATVRIDLTRPSLAFANSQDPVRPEEISAPVSDALSGVVSGQIFYRPRGAASWRALPTQLRDRQAGGQELAAEFPSDTLERGYYELRAEATDRAGNTVATDRRGDGSQMVLRTPLKVETALSVRFLLPFGGARAASGRTAVVPYRRRARVGGVLQTVAGVPLAGEPVRILQRPLPGSISGPHARTVTTDGGGGFVGRLPGGPSRRIEVSYAGSPTLTRVAAAPLRLLSRTSATLAITPRRVLNRESVRMRGTVGHAGARIPRRGKLVEIQFLDTRRHRWRPVQLLRTNRRGQFRFSYRFLYVVKPARIAFRVAVPREAGFPFVEGHSGVVRVNVYP